MDLEVDPKLALASNFATLSTSPRQNLALRANSIAPSTKVIVCIRFRYSSPLSPDPALGSQSALHEEQNSDPLAQSDCSLTTLHSESARVFSCLRAPLNCLL